MSASHPASCHCTECCIHLLLHVEVKQHCLQSLALARMGGHGIGRGEWHLRAVDLQHGRLPSAVQEPGLSQRCDGVHAWLLYSIQLPLGPFKLHIDNGWSLAVGMPDPRMHSSNGALEKQLVLGPVDMMGDRRSHSYGQREHAAKVASVTIMILQPPAVRCVTIESM